MRTKRLTGTAACFVIIMLSLVSPVLHAQSPKDSIPASELTDIYSIPVVVKINDIILYDTSISYPWIRNNHFKIQNERYYKSEKAMKKFGINSTWGILVIILKKGYRYP